MFWCLNCLSFFKICQICSSFKIYFHHWISLTSEKEEIQIDKQKSTEFYCDIHFVYLTRNGVSLPFFFLKIKFHVILLGQMMNSVCLNKTSNTFTPLWSIGNDFFTTSSVEFPVEWYVTCEHKIQSLSTKFK